MILPVHSRVLPGFKSVHLSMTMFLNSSDPWHFEATFRHTLTSPQGYPYSGDKALPKMYAGWLSYYCIGRFQIVQPTIFSVSSWDQSKWLPSPRGCLALGSWGFARGVPDGVGGHIYGGFCLCCNSAPGAEPPRQFPVPVGATECRWVAGCHPALEPDGEQDVVDRAMAGYLMFASPPFAYGELARPRSWTGEFQSSGNTDFTCTLTPNFDMG